MKEYKLSQLLEIKNGKDHKELPNGDYPVFGSGGVMRYVNEYLYDKPSILLPRKGSLNNIQYCDVPFWTVDTLYYTEVNEKIACPYYLYNYLCLLDLSGLDTGTGVPSMTFDSYYNIKVLIPEIEEQKRVASVLQNLDHKIALNRQINDNLEEMAKQLYDYWFVQFDFPNEDGKPYKSSGGAMVWKEKLKREIPQGWSISNVKSLIEPIERGVSYSSDDLLDPFATPMINLACFSKAGDYRLGEMKFFSGKVSNDKLISPMDMLIACTDMTQGADIIGRPILASDEYDQYTFSTDLALITPKGKFKMYLYYTLRTPFYHKYIRPFASGTTVKHLNLIGVENYGLPVPPIEIQSKFEDLITPIKEKQSKNLNEINALTKQRDELLPLLMNGQATINYHLSARTDIPTLNLQNLHYTANTIKISITFS